MEMNPRYKSVIKYTSRRLPQHLHQTYPAELSIPLWDQDDGLPGALLQEVNLTEGGL